MNVASVLALLVQMGVCAPVQFSGPADSKLTVIVCPMMEQAPADEEPKGPTI